MTRREVIMAGAGILATGILKSTASAAATKGASSDNREALIEAALNCVKTGEICQQHCLDLLSAGDKSMADCAKSVAEMLTLCRALGELAAQRSPYLAKVAALCGDACKACEKACRVHESHHAICKNCAESCAKCASECAKVSA